MSRTNGRDMVKAGLLAALAVLGTEPAPAQMWCLRSFGDPPYRNCVFPSAEQCVLAVRIGGGICGRDERPPGKTVGRQPATARPGHPGARARGKVDGPDRGNRLGALLAPRSS